MVGFLQIVWNIVMNLITLILAAPVGIVKNVWPALKLQLRQPAIIKLIYCLDYNLYKFWTAIYREPDHTDIVVFNELARKCPGFHSITRCCKKYCETCRVERIIMYIDKAKVSIDMAHLTFSHRLFYDAIVAAWDRGVHVRIVCDSQMVCVRGSVVLRLWSMGIPVHPAPLRIMMHHKFCIIDGERRILQMDARQQRSKCRLWKCKGYIVTGSLNWTKQGTGNNYENVVVTSNRKVNSLYQNVFNNLWDTFPPLRTMDFNTQDFPTTYNGKNVYN